MGKSDLAVSETADAGGVTVALTGELDGYASRSKMRVLIDRLRGGTGAVFLDLRGLDFIDSPGLACLITLHRQLSAASRDFCVYLRRTGQVSRVLYQSMIDRMFPCVRPNEPLLGGDGEVVASDAEVGLNEKVVDNE